MRYLKGFVIQERSFKNVKGKKKKTDFEKYIPSRVE